MNPTFPPPLSGSYVLHFQIATETNIPIGRLGLCHFPQGDYFYFGSARGSGGLKARVRHHLNSTAAPHWHLDYLHGVITFQTCFYGITTENLECLWSQSFRSLPDSFVPVPGFGSSDCNKSCSSHLILMKNSFSMEGTLNTLQKSVKEEVFVIIINSPKHTKDTF